MATFASPAMKKIVNLMVAFTVVGCGRETAPEPPITEASVAEAVIVKPVAEIIPPELPPPPAISIWDAARAGDLEAVRGHIDSRENLDEPDAVDPLKPTPLHCAVASGHKAVAELLLARGVDINAKRADGLTALDIVLKADPESSDEDRAHRKGIAGVLVRNGATAAKHK